MNQSVPTYRQVFGRRLLVSTLAAIGMILLPSAPAPLYVEATPSAGTTWLARFNAWRGATGVASLVENTTWSAGDYDHAIYMVKNDLVTHYETAGTPYYTVAGDTAARDGNIFVSSTTATTDDQAIDWWMGAPFHAMGMMDPRLASTGFGSYREVKSGWQMGAAVDVLRGNSFTGGKFPVFFPGNGTTEPLTTYSGNEYPDPLQACPGYTAPTGLPVFVEVGGNVTATAGAHSLTGNGVALAHCVIDGSNAALGSYLNSRGGLIVIPRQPLVTGVQYMVNVTVNGVPYAWSFSVGPLAALPPPPAAVTATSTGTTATVTWTPSAGLAGTAPTSYTVTPYMAGVAQTPQVVMAPTTSATFSGLASWTAYRFAVSATSSVGTGSPAWTNYVIPGWQSAGGTLSSSPAIVAAAVGRLDVFARGTDNAIWQRTWTGSTWTSWQSLGGNLTSGPSAAGSPGRIDIFARGADNALWHRTWNGTAWLAWESLGGTLSSDPSAATSGPSDVMVFARGTDNAIWSRSWNGTAWAAWQSLGGTLTSAPGSVSWAGGRIDVFARGTDKALWHRAWNGTVWLSWESLGGTLSSGPDAASCASGRLDVFALGTDAQLWRRSFNGSWASWTPLGGQWTVDPGAVCSASPTVNLVERGPDAAIWSTTVTGT